MITLDLNKIVNRTYACSTIIAGLLVILCTTSYGQIPKLNSNSTAKATAYIDFDGHLVEGTGWNWEFDTIKAKPVVLKQQAINEIFERVAEDYRIFNLNITTDPSVFTKAPPTKRIRIIVTPTSAWYTESKAPGVSFVNSFTWGDGTPSWVFSDRLFNNPKYIGEAISHELGHTLGLQHQSTYDKSCNKTKEYAEGKGDGEISWAPIMGIGYYKNLTTWHVGTNTEGCDVIQNDINIIRREVNGVTLRTDDHANNRTNATLVSVRDNSFASNGMINNAPDKDVFKIVLNQTSVLKADAIPRHVAAGNSGANLDIKMSLLKSNGDTIGNYNPKNLLSASLDTNLKAGTYYVVIDGVANQNLPDYGSIGYYSFSGSINVVLPITKLTVRGNSQNEKHIINWTFEADEPVKESVIETSSNGIDFTPLTILAPSATRFSYTPYGQGQIFYRVKMVVVRDDQPYYSNIISMQCALSKNISLQSNMITQSAQVIVNGSYSYQLLDASGRMLQHGKLATGLNRIEMQATEKGLLLLKVYNEKEQSVFKLIKQ